MHARIQRWGTGGPDPPPPLIFEKLSFFWLIIVLFINFWGLDPTHPLRFEKILTLFMKSQNIIWTPPPLGKKAVSAPGMYQLITKTVKFPFSRGSSDGRASDRLSGGPRFDPGLGWLEIFLALFESICITYTYISRHTVALDNAYTTFNYIQVIYQLTLCFWISSR